MSYGVKVEGEVAYRGTFGLKSGSCIECGWWLEGETTATLHAELTAETNGKVIVGGGKWDFDWDIDVDAASITIPITLNLGYNSADACDGIESSAYIGKVQWKFLWWDSDDSAYAVTDDNYGCEPALYVSKNVFANDVLPDGATASFFPSADQLNGTESMRSNGSYIYHSNLPPEYPNTLISVSTYLVPQMDEDDDSVGIITVTVRRGAQIPGNPNYIPPVTTNHTASGERLFTLWDTYAE